MERLLKIVEGPMRGAEIALVAGTRVKVGSGEDCDIVVADASLGDVAFELDVTEGAVTLVTPDGETKDLADFEIYESGSTAVAVGPAEGAWGELRRPEPKAEPAAGEEPAKDAAAEGEGEGKAEKEAADEKAADDKKDKEDQEGKKGGKGRRIGCLVLLLILLLLLLVAAFLGYRHRERLRPYAERLRPYAERWHLVSVPSDAAKPEERVTISDIARAHGLRVEERDGQTILAGNLRRRTERLAIRALALAADRTVRFDLTDDQSLKSAVADTLALVAGGRLKVTAVTNRVAALEGSVSGPLELANVLRALNEEVPQLVSCGTVGVTAATADGEPVAIGAAGPRRNGKAAKPAPAPAEKPAGPVVPHLPVAGILTVPYPCVVLTDGSRCLAGSRIGGLVLERISAEELVFRSGGVELKWRP